MTDRDPAMRGSPTPGRRSRWPWLLLAVVLPAVVLLAALAYRAIGPASRAPADQVSSLRSGTARSGAGSGARPGSEAARVLPVTVAPVTSTDFPVTLGALGTVTPLNTVTVRSQVDGTLMRVHFDDGQFVDKGALLAEIDPRPYEVQLAQAQGTLARDRALLENAKVDLERYRTLIRQDAASAQQLDTQAALVHQYEGALKTDQAQVDHAKLQLGYTKITAPIAGRLGLRLVDPGNLIRAGDATGIVTITQIEPIAVTFSLPEKDIAAVLARYRDGVEMKALALDRDLRDVLATGRLTTIDNQIDTTTGTLKMRAQFPNAHGELFPNQFVNVRLLVDTLADATIVPNAAIQRGAPGTYVYVVRDDDRVALRTVSLGPTDGVRSVVRDGVEVGERVVIDGVDNLRDGMRVEPIDKDAAQRAADEPGVPRARSRR